MSCLVYNLLMKILAIESSCDDTSVSIVENGTKVLSTVISSQADIHSKYGGVVPEVAARHHLENMIPVLDKALSDAKLKLPEIDAIAVTKGPGLIGSLIVGVNTARTLAKIYKKPLIAVHHTEGHIYANWLSDNLRSGHKPPIFPLVCLTVSGGHTNLIYMEDHLDYKIVGETIDDAAGEAFDKVAKMLGLSYPGGPEISAYAKAGCETTFSFPRVDLTKPPARNEQGFLEKPAESLNFSFSGLKTAVLKEVREKERSGKLTKQDISDISASFQTAAVDILTRNLLRAVDKHKPISVLLSGGVAANNQLRESIENSLQKNVEFYFPKSLYCTDNAAMIASAAYQHFLKNDFTDPNTLTPDPNLKLC